MKIAIIARNFNILPSPSYKAWAPGIVIANEVNTLTEMGENVRIYCAKGSKVEGEIVHFNLPAGGDIFSGLSANQKAIREIYLNTLFQTRIIEDLKRNPVDIIHLHDYRDAPLYLSADLKTPIVVTLHGDFFYNFNKMPTILKSEINKISFITIGVQNLIPKGISSPIAFIPNIINFNEFNFIAKSKKRFVFIGRLTYEKGLDLAIDVAIKAGVDLDIYGSFQGDEKWEKMIKTLISKHKNIALRGFLPHNKIAIAFNATALISPMREPEGFPSVMIESLACGTPVVAFNSSGAKTILQNKKNGYLIKQGDIKTMVQALKNIDLIDRSYCREDIIVRFDKFKIGQELINLFQEVIYKYN